jgi:murein DD-endopeptidase MepM/ murein hydrolase activator NlpD
MRITKRLRRTVAAFAAAAALATTGVASASAADYKLPYPAGESYRVTQGNFGSYSHTDAYNQYAWDFALPYQYEVSATQAGTVASAGWSPYWQNGVEMLIRHSNGQCTHYAHLDRVLYGAGSWVPQGRVVAWSGNSGASSAPHLHYQAINCSNRVGIASTLQGYKPGAGSYPVSTNTRR